MTNDSTNADGTRCSLGLRFGELLDEVLGAWQAKEAVHSVYLIADPDEAAVLLDDAVAACRNDEVPEIRTPRPHIVALERRDLEPPSHRGIERANGGVELLRHAGQEGRTGLHELRALQAACPTPSRSCHLDEADQAPRR